MHWHIELSNDGGGCKWPRLQWAMADSVLGSGRTRRNDLLHKSRATSSRDQVGRGCQLNCSLNSEASSMNGQ